MIRAIVTIPPYAPYIREVIKHPAVSGLRLNTVMPVKSLEDVLKKLKDETSTFNKDLWVDLKCRQLRIKDYGVPPFTQIELMHNLEVKTPVTAYFSDLDEYATVLEIDGNKLIMQEGPNRVVGPGESINIPHHSLKIHGYFTDTDKRYIEAGEKIGITNYMLSFVEGKGDINAFRKLSPNSKVAAKIESQKGLQYVANTWNQEAQLMAARGDLYVELEWPHYITQAVESIVRKDPNAIVASRILDSLARSYTPSCADIGDLDNLLRMGYQNLMLGDDICLKRDSIISGLNVIEKMADHYHKFYK